jgi:hypothetical protein
MHDAAREGRLGPDDLAAYRAGRDELARALLAAQRLTLKPGEKPRQALRVARALQVDLDLATDAVRAVTIDLSTGGFSCLLARAPAAGDELKFSLRVPASEPVVGRCRVADVKPLQGSVRVALQLVGLSEADRERLETFVFDTVLAQLSA